ncbi:MAG: rhodanese-like domain-containing protein [Pleomorphochaeta sp.]
MDKKKTLILISIIFIIILTPVFASGNQEKNTNENETQIEIKYNKISAEEAKSIFDSNNEAIIIDVRTEEEFNSSHIPNAINIPLSTIEEEVLKQYPNKDQTLYLYCRSGNRSSQAARILMNNGYYNIYDFGGIIDWPYEVVK